MHEDVRAIEHVSSRSTGPPIPHGLRVTVHFHPDRDAGGVTTIEAMAHDGRYRSQFETGTSNGGLTAFPGGDRWRWESRMFGGAYDGAPAGIRPAYGALNLDAHPAGGSPRFGSAHFRLGADVLPRMTFCYPDSVFDPVDVGTAAQLGLIELIRSGDGRTVSGDPLDHYIEAHVHRPIEFDRDVEAVVLDPCHRGTGVERAAHRLGCAVEWHPGFRLAADTLRRNVDYRGADIVELGLSLAHNGFLDARLIGDASREHPERDQELKRVWHYLARFGAPA